MIPVSKGLAKFRIDATEEVVIVSPEDLDWQQNGGDERQMGTELRYAADFEFSSEKEGDSYSAQWELFEYPTGCQNYDNFTVSSGITVIENFKNGLEHENE
jgi:hypothetical protein